MTEEETERIGKTGIEPQKTVDRQKRNGSCSTSTSIAESKQICEAAPQLSEAEPRSQRKKKRNTTPFSTNSIPAGIARKTSHAIIKSAKTDPDPPVPQSTSLKISGSKRNTQKRFGDKN